MNPHPVSAISFDAQKASDRVEWAFFLSATLSKFGFGDSFCRWIKVFYSSPKAAVFANWIIPQFFSITRSTGWGAV